MREKLFVDTNVFLYFLTKHESKWQKIASVFDGNNYELATNALVLNELKYKFLWLASSEKLNTNNKFTIINHIKKDKKLREDVYSKFLEFYTNAKERFLIFDFTDKEEILSCQISNNYGLLPTDASIVASMIKNNIKKIMTDDSDFKKVGLIEVIEV